MRLVRMVAAAAGALSVADETGSLSIVVTGVNVSWTSYAANATPSAAGTGPRCADGSAAPQGWLWNILYNDHYTPAGQTTPLAGLPAVSSQAGATGYVDSGGGELLGPPPRHRALL